METINKKTEESMCMFCEYYREIDYDLGTCEKKHRHTSSGRESCEDYKEWQPKNNGGKK